MSLTGKMTVTKWRYYAGIFLTMWFMPASLRLLDIARESGHRGWDVMLGTGFGAVVFITMFYFTFEKGKLGQRPDGTVRQRDQERQG